ncbi:Predicted acetyltransferase, GNAT superfamily [Gemmobacter aquatilis]|uniref:Predicted acetyltransferase, GNAT superfamily n=1 Tax=Gemmobacter aquatilis TaxID=933059 RepID=A0A1H8I269_9RHOB|nr:GNAT family N-acetyltransferase [Gemmobacter aquatilis]SEN62008.1 Predicted acetyltransferase, GNAT superfamily [Gemmobacter aquatilis]
MRDILFRDLSGMAEFSEAEALQRAVWGEGDKEDPADLMMVVQHEGGLAAGAFRNGQMLGYVFAFPTATPGVQHSHRLAVRAEARGLGLGLRLKWYQRDWCLARGISHVRWTYDPLRLANASLNIHRLGAEANHYLPDYYGAMEGINKGAPSDRLMADWWLNSPRVAACAAGNTLPADPVETLEIPEDFGALLQDDPHLAHALRLHSRAVLQAAFARGLKIAGFDPTKRSYLLCPADPA